MQTQRQNRTREAIIAGLTDPGLVAVIRTKKPGHVIPVCEALLAGGVRAIEVTMTVPGALDLVQEMSERFSSEAVVGAGSILNGEMCREAIERGAEFIVTPVCKPEVAAVARALNRVTMLGCYTPTEAQTAHEAGADFVKIFPADGLGPNYIKSLLAPLPHLRIVPTGGVVIGNAAEFLKAGCAALGVGSSLLTREILEAEDWPALTRHAEAFVTAIRTR